MADFQNLFPKLELPEQSVAYVEQRAGKLYWIEAVHLELLALDEFLLTGKTEEFTGMEVSWNLHDTQKNFSQLNIEAGGL